MDIFIHNLVQLTLDSAPWLLLGLVLAGLIKVWLPMSVLERHLGGHGPRPVLLAALLGAPLPLCSCGVIPAAIGLRRAGASPGATLSFLISTPETGVDSVLLSHALLGPFMAVVRPVAAVCTAVAAGLIAPRDVVTRRRTVPILAAPAVAGQTGCQGGGCCDSAAPVSQQAGWLGRSLAGVRYAFDDIWGDIYGWVFVGLLAAALLLTLVPPQSLASWGSGWQAMVLMLVVGVPMYICATASTPLAAAFISAGMSPGAALVFLLAGPATNMATLALVKREFGLRGLGSYLGAIVVCALAFGMLTDLLAELGGFSVTVSQVAADPSSWESVLAPGAALLLLIPLLWRWWRT
ncbi:MAG: SO_0444 family Cu/Zn efflux transporter [Magnetococcus sp. WYHC-3]